MQNYILETIECRGNQICCPFFDGKNEDFLYYVSAGTGEIFQIDAQMQFSLAVTSSGHALGATFDLNHKIHIADATHAAILRVNNEDTRPGVVVKVYEERPFKGPSSITLDDNGGIYFTDSGPLGETTIERPKGSVYYIGNSPGGGQILRPLALECLAHPCGIALSVDNNFLFVTEMLRNRVLRFVQRPKGVYHFSVFYQFSGGIGPSCVACDEKGRLYVGLYDFSGTGDKGKIQVISSCGKLETIFEVPGTEITGVAIRNDKILYVSEASTNSIYKIALDSTM